jgi:hypothetical protein
MFGTTYKRPLTTLTVVGGLLIAAAPASAAESPKDQLSGVHAQRAVSDGTSNTVLFGEIAGRGPTTVGLPACDGQSKDPS